MKVKWTLNNNAVICDDEHGVEIVVKGKGIAYGLKKGDRIDSTKIERIFEISDTNVQRRYQEVLLTIPEDCITITEKLIDMIKENISKDISDNIYITLTDHISSLLERHKMGIIFDDYLLWDIRHLYPEEYELGLKAVDIIEDRFHIKVEDDEASFIALHIVNAELGDNMDLIIKTTKVIEDICDIVVSDFNLELNKESIAYSRFMMHLRVFMERVMRQEQYLDTNQNNKIIIDSLRKSYEQQYLTTIKITDYIAERFNINFSGEILYLLIHVIKITSEGGESIAVMDSDS